MRRKDRQVIDKKDLEEILKLSKVCRIAMNDDDGIYIVPVNFGYTFNDDELEIFFHGAKEGKKAQILSNGNVYVGFEMDFEGELITSDTPCGFSIFYKSIIGKGYVNFILEKDEKIKALNHLMMHQYGKSFDFNDKMLDDVFIFSIKSKDYSAKKKQ